MVNLQYECVKASSRHQAAWRISYTQHTWMDTLHYERTEATSRYL